MGRAYDRERRATSSVRRPAAPPAPPDVTAGPPDLAAVLAARGDTGRVVLEGVHALKHAVRFGADIEVVVTPDRSQLGALLAALAPDVVLPSVVHEVTDTQWRQLVPRGLPSPALAVARRPSSTADDVLSAPGRVVVLEQPRHLGNLGAVVRVAAAADAGGVLVLGDVDPWHPTAVRAAAGLQLALPVAGIGGDLPALPVVRPVVALDPEGADLDAQGLPGDAVLLVGTERAGLSTSLRARADRLVRLPMRPGVSSLNLATAVAAALYTGTGPRPPTLER